MTIAGGNGGVTVEGNSAVTSASAAISTCSSLSQKACYGLQESYCTEFGTSGETTSSGQFVTGSNAPMRKSSLHEILIAVAAGVVGRGSGTRALWKYKAARCRRRGGIPTTIPRSCSTK